MKRLISIIVLLLLLSGCSKSPRESLESYLNKYNSLSSDVLVDMETTINKEEYNDEQKEKYRNILKKQYQDLSYEILEEEYDDEVSYITVKINVYDYYKESRNASIYLENNKEEFLDINGVYDVNKYIDYKLDMLKNTTERVSYTVTFTIVKEDGKYTVEQPSDIDLQKIHGIYNYEMD